MARRRRAHLFVAALCVCAGVALVVCLVESGLSAARAKRQSYGYGSDVAAHVVSESAARLLQGLTPKEERQIASASGGLISDHDLFMLVEAAKFHIARDEGLSSALAAGRLPVRYAYLDGYDSDRTVLRKSIADDLATSEPGTWITAPVLLGLPASPSVRTVAAEVADDDPLMSVHTCGQVLTRDVSERWTRYRLSSVRFSTTERAEQVAAIEARLAEVCAAVEARAGTDADDAAYTRAAFDELAETLSYADEKTSPHYNDVYGALVEGTARCYGLCGALKLVLDARGIPNYIADGTKPTGRHSWNVVWTDGSWRVCDLTLMLNREEGNACLVLEQNFNTQHAYVPDDECRVLELLYSRVVTEGL